MTIQELLVQYNASDPADVSGRQALLEQIFGAPCEAWADTPFYCRRGTNITLGAGTYIHAGGNFVDDGHISIGSNVLICSGVTVATVGALPEGMGSGDVTIGDNCWIGENCIICPGVTIGENAVIESGSVVARNIPANCTAGGNPCTPIARKK